MASYLTLLWSTGLRQLVAYPPPPQPHVAAGAGGAFIDWCTVKKSCLSCWLGGEIEGDFRRKTEHDRKPTEDFQLDWFHSFRGVFFKYFFKKVPVKKLFR